MLGLWDICEPTTITPDLLYETLRPSDIKRLDAVISFFKVYHVLTETILC